AAGPAPRNGFATGSPRPVVWNVFEAGLLAHVPAHCAAPSPSRLRSGVSKGPGAFTVAGAAVALTTFPLSSGVHPENLERAQATQRACGGQSPQLTLGRTRDVLARFFQVPRVAVREVKREIGASISDKSDAAPATVSDRRVKYATVPNRHGKACPSSPR